MTKRMKIFRITTWLDFGGVEKRFVNLSTSTAIHELVFIALGKGGWAETEIKKNGKRVICLDRNPKIPNLSLIRELIRIIKREKPDVVHTSGAEANFHGTIAAFVTGVPVRIAEEIGYPNHSFPFRLVFRLVYSLSHRVIGISRSVIDRVVALGEVPRRKSHVIYNPLPATSIEASRHDGKCFELVTVCRLFEVKNLGVLLRLVHDLKTAFALRLVIVGDGPERESLERMSRELGISENVSFEGFKEDPTPFLRKANAFILPSYSEGLSNSLLEAMAIGLPCIATREGGPSELIKNGENGWLINPFDYDDIKKVMTAVLQQSPEHRANVGAKARTFVRNDFSLEKHEFKLIELYTSVKND